VNSYVNNKKTQKETVQAMVAEEKKTKNHDRHPKDTREIQPSCKVQADQATTGLKGRKEKNSSGKPHERPVRRERGRKSNQGGNNLQFQGKDDQAEDGTNTYLLSGE